MATTQAFRIGAIYRGAVRDLHLRYDVPIREQKGLLDSVFYIDGSDLTGELVIAGVHRIIAHEAAISAAERADEERAAWERRERQKRIANGWRRLTFRRPLS